MKWEAELTASEIHAATDYLPHQFFMNEADASIEGETNRTNTEGGCFFAKQTALSWEMFVRNRSVATFPAASAGWA